MARYRQTDTRWIRGSCVGGAYLVGVAVLFTLQVGAAIVVPLPLAVSAPPLVYAALSILLMPGAPFVRRLAWVGGACLVHVLLGTLASMQLMWAGGLSAVSALSQVFVLFAPAPALTLLATPVVLTSFGLKPSSPTSRMETVPARADGPSPRGESATPRQAAGPASPRATSFAREARGRNGAIAPRAVATPPVVPSAPPSNPAFARPSAPSAGAASAPTSMPGVVSAPSVAAPVTSPVAPATIREVPSVEVRRPARRGSPAPSVDDVMVRVSFDRIAPQLPAEAFVLPFERLGESLKEPQVLLVPRRVVLAQMREGGIAIDWATVAPQFPELALGISEAEFRYRYRDLKLSLPLDEVLSQLPPDTVPLVSAVVNAEGLETVPPRASPPRTVSPADLATSFAGAPTLPPVAAVAAAPTVPAPLVAPAVPTPPAVVLATPVDAPAPARAAEPVDREIVRRAVACFGGVGTFEAAGERIGATTLVTLVAPSLSHAAVASSAARLAGFLAAGPGELVTVRTTRAVLVLAAATTPIVVAARRPGAPVALLELRAARAAAAVGDAPPTTPPTRSLKLLTVDDRVDGAGQALTSFGFVEPTVFGDGAARVYVFSVPGGDARPVGALALGVCEAFREGGADLGRLVSVVFRRGGERTLVRPLGNGGAVLAAAGPVTRPGRLHRDAERAATVLEVL